MARGWQAATSVPAPASAQTASPIRAKRTPGDNSYNELLSVETDKHMLFMTAGMVMFNRGDKDARLTDEGAAEPLWSMFIGNLQQ